MTFGAPDFSTPEGAIRALENAYANQNIEEAVAAKDFSEEARLMLVRINPQLAGDAEILKKTTEVLELAFRKKIKDDGFPDLKEIHCSLNNPQQVTDTLVKVTESCRFPDGTTSMEDLHVAKGPKGWRVVVVAA